MSAVVVLAPVMAAAWPTVSASVMGAAAVLGFAKAAGRSKPVCKEECVSIEVKGSQVVTDGMSNDESLMFVKGDATVTFSRDARGACEVNVRGASLTQAELKAIGEEFAGQVVQQYAYHRLMEELARKDFTVVSQEVGDDRTIHVSVRRFD